MTAVGHAYPHRGLGRFRRPIVGAPGGPALPSAAPALPDADVRPIATRDPGSEDYLFDLILRHAREVTRDYIGGRQLDIDGYPSAGWLPSGNPWKQGNAKKGGSYLPALTARYKAVLEAASQPVASLDPLTESLLADLFGNDTASFYGMCAVPLLLRATFPDAHFDMLVPVQKFAEGYPGRKIDEEVILRVLMGSELNGMTQSAFLAVAKKMPYFMATEIAGVRSRSNFVALIRLLSEANWRSAAHAEALLLRLTHLHVARHSHDGSLQTVPSTINQKAFWEIIDALLVGQPAKHMLQFIVSAAASVYTGNNRGSSFRAQGLYEADARRPDAAGDITIFNGDHPAIAIDVTNAKITPDKFELATKKAMAAGCAQCFVVNVDGARRAEVPENSTVGEMNVSVEGIRSLLRNLCQIGIQRGVEHKILGGIMTGLHADTRPANRIRWNQVILNYKGRKG